MRSALLIVCIFLTNLGREARTDDRTNLCRSRNHIFYPQNEFDLHSCVFCYRFMSNYSFKNYSPVDSITLEALMKNCTGYEDLLVNEVLVRSFMNRNAVEKWQKCCKNAHDCCVSMLANKIKKEENWCPGTWDGWLCWPDAPPGKEVQKLCPHYAVPSTEKCSQLYATKMCEENGKWAVHPQYKDNEWTNYTLCSAKARIEKRTHISIGFYALSVIALVPAIIIFQKFRSLRCHRIILHKNLFASLLLYCFTQIAFNFEYVLDDLSGNSRIIKSEIECKALLVATKYFRLTNYFWMFSEGFYLHRQIINVFAEETSLKLFYAIGWGFPIIPLIIFIMCHSLLDDTNCWALPSTYIDWALHAPCLFCLLINTVFLIHIVTILIKKLRSGHLDERVQFRKAVKATFVLVPLFGVHFFFTLYRKTSVCTSLEEGYTYLGKIFDGGQGFLVALIFCYINSEVLAVMKRFVRNLRDKHNISQFPQSSCNGTLTTEASSQTAL